jgi:hypothetical protein
MSETKFTPGPWRWELNRKGKRVQLCGGVPRFDLTVMDFIRWGMGGAQPRFLEAWKSNSMMLLENAPKFGKDVPGREHHSDWFQTIDHPDAHLIAAAPDLYAALALVEQHFQRNQVSGNFQGDDEHEAWTAVSAALKKARGEA